MINVLSEYTSLQKTAFKRDFYRACEKNEIKLIKLYVNQYIIPEYILSRAYSVVIENGNITILKILYSYNNVAFQNNVSKILTSTINSYQIEILKYVLKISDYKIFENNKNNILFILVYHLAHYSHLDEEHAKQKNSMLKMLNDYINFYQFVYDHHSSIGIIPYNILKNIIKQVNVSHIFVSRHIKDVIAKNDLETFKYLMTNYNLQSNCNTENINLTIIHNSDKILKLILNTCDSIKFNYDTIDVLNIYFKSNKILHALLYDGRINKFIADNYSEFYMGVKEQIREYYKLSNINDVRYFFTFF